jgi:RHS repeat-associated protein
MSRAKRSTNRPGEYDAENRMAYSEVTRHAEKTRAISHYAYDALGRRTLTENAAGQALRAVYDGRSFEIIREGEAFRNGSLTTQFATGEGARAATGGAAASGVASPGGREPAAVRYRWIGDDYNGIDISEDGYAVESSRYGLRGATLYGNGEAVAMSYSSSTSSRSVYLGKDILGSVRTATGSGGAVEDRYEYDAFGQAYRGDLSGVMNLGYTGKPYNAGTGLYNYGYRDYRPQAARFTTVDPIRDGSNWYAYVNNDPVNWIDPWGLEATNNSNNSVYIKYENADQNGNKGGMLEPGRTYPGDVDGAIVYNPNTGEVIIYKVYDGTNFIISQNADGSYVFIKTIDPLRDLAGDVYSLYRKYSLAGEYPLDENTPADLLRWYNEAFKKEPEVQSWEAQRQDSRTPRDYNA